MNILEEFWYGNLDPAEYDASPSEEYTHIIPRSLSARQHDVFQSTLHHQ